MSFPEAGVLFAAREIPSYGRTTCGGLYTLRFGVRKLALAAGHQRVGHNDSIEVIAFDLVRAAELP